MPWRAAGIARVGLRVVVDHPSVWRQLRHHQLLDRRGPRQQVVGGRLDQLAGESHQPNIERDEDGGKAGPRHPAEPRPDPHEYGAAGAERQRDGGGHSHGVREVRAQRHTREHPHERARRSQGPHRQRRHHPEGEQRRDPVVPGQAIPQPGRLGAVDPTGEEDAGGRGHGDHVAALQSLVPVERQGVEEMLEGGVGAQREEEAEKAHGVPRQTVAGRNAAGPARMQQGHQRDDRQDAEVDADFRQVVLAEELRLAEMPVPTVEIGHQAQDGEGPGITPRRGDHPCATLRIADGLESGKPLDCRQGKGERRSRSTPRQDTPPPLAVETGRHDGERDDQQCLVEHRLWRTGQDHRRIGDPEEDGPAPTAVTDDVQDSQEHPGDRDESLRHVHVVDLAQHRSGEGVRGGRKEAGHRRELQRPEEDVHPDGDRREGDDLGGQPRGAIGQDDEESRQRIEGAGVEIGHEGRAAEDVLVPERQLPVAQHRTDQDVQREILLQVVPRDQQPAPDQVREHEGGGRDGDQHDVRPQGSDACSKSLHWRGDAFRGTWGRSLRPFHLARGRAGAIAQASRSR